jgi:hypothetical protein
MGLPPWGGKDMSAGGKPMKKIAIRTLAIAGGLVAVLVAGGASSGLK